MKRRRVAMLIGGCLLAGPVLAAGLYAQSLGPAPLGHGIEVSHAVLDRNGKLLRAYATPEGRLRLPVRTDEVDPRLVKLLLAYEDKRFYRHHGIDIFALGRAAVQLLTQGGIVSGGSTITMQVARLLEPREHRSFAAKLRQMVRALQIERSLSKTEIIGLYLTLAPYGGNLEGARAASLAYFGKEPRHLSLAEAALLVALPQSPEARRPDRAAWVALAARNRVLDRLVAAGVVPRDEAARAESQPVPSGRRQLPTLAPQAADEIVLAEPGAPVHRLTIDADLQSRLQALAHERAQLFGPDVSVAMLAVDNATGQVRAHVGSADYFDARRAGQIDMTQALRSPGSALKPFIYGMGFEDGFIHPETLIDDKPLRFGTYAPENFDLSFQGTLSVRRALQFSLNVPAIAVLDRVGVERLAARLRQAGAALILPKGDAPGLAVGLGGIGITLADLTTLYAGIARGGTVLPLKEKLAEPNAIPRRLLDPVAAWYVGSILIGAPPPENAPPARIAFKTGTSYGYRDAWAIGFDGRMTIGVWVGRADGSPVPGIVGRLTAAPILFDAFARSERVVPLGPPPKGVIFATNARLPPPLRHFRSNSGPGEVRDAPRIMFPPNGARLELAADGAPVPLRITGGRGPLTVMINGVPQQAQGGRHTLSFRPDGPGFMQLTVMDGRGLADSVAIRLQ